MVETRVVRYWRPCYQTPEGQLVIAPLPPEVTGHFGANLVRYLLSQHYQCRVTMPLLHQQLQDVGILISAGQISNLLTKGHDAFHAEKAAVKQAGLETARWISVDDTGARHLGINGVTTQIGDDRFTSFDTVASKSRLMFLMTLRGAFQDYVINPAALIYLHEHDAPETLIDRLIEPDDRVFADEDVWTDHLIALGITGAKAVRLASEAAVAGSLDHHGLLQDAVIVSDGAGQFDVLRHGLCWIHAERLIHRLVTVTEEQRAAVALVRHLIWWFYRDLKLYRTDPSARARASLKARFDRIFTRTTGFAELDELLARLKLRKAELLVTLERPEVPLNTNSSEQDVRDPVTLRKISGGTRARTADDAAIPSCRSRKPARRTPSPSGTISATASASPQKPSATCRTSFVSVPPIPQPDRHQFLSIHRFLALASTSKSAHARCSDTSRLTAWFHMRWEWARRSLTFRPRVLRTA